MKTQILRLVRLSALVMTVVAVGCSTTREGHKQQTALEPTHPTKTARGGVSSAPKSTTQLLREAEQAFRTANSAQERGDFEAALRHYNRMLELLVQADLDPGVFYNLRSEFERILHASPGEHRQLFDPQDRERVLSELEQLQRGMQGPSVYGDLQIPEALQERVQVEIREIQELYPRNFQYGLNRSTKYLPYIQDELRKAGLPQDLAWLAMVESQFTPKIDSRAGAGGMWQFMRTTASRFGLRIDNYVDERYNWQKSTHAAIAYLGELYSRFNGEWPLAVSAYNMGEGGMERVVAMNNGDTELVRLIEQPPASNVMRNETKKFYPKLLASIAVAKEPEKYGFTLEPQAPDLVVRMPVQGAYSLAALDSACGLPEGTLAKLNPDLIRGVTPPGAQHMLAVPAEAQERFAVALRDVPQESRALARISEPKSTRAAATSKSTKEVAPSAKQSHTVRRGETLESIASMYGVTVDELMDANKMRTHRLIAGRKLSVPASKNEASTTKSETPTTVAKAKTPSASPAKSATAAPTEFRSYKVKSGDTLFEIAKREGVSISDLQAWNGLKNGASLKAGQTLKVAPGSPGAASSGATPAAAGKVEHTVKAGDTPAKIASTYGVALSDLLQWNNLKATSTIQPGQKLSIMKDGAPGSQKPDTTQVAKAETPTAPKAVEKADQAVTHKVAKGETPGAIAEKYRVSLKDLLAANGLTSKSTIQVGQSLKIPSGASSKSTTSAAKASAPAKAETKTIVHTVTKGQTPTGIAKKYNVSVDDLYRWNGWKKDHVINIDDKVKVETK